MRVRAPDGVRFTVQLLRHRYAFYEGARRSLQEVFAEVQAFECPLVEITGGEPLLQKNVLPLMTALCNADRTVLIETSGAHDISRIDPRVHRIMDLKTPSSGELARNLYSNIAFLNHRDEVKFVIGSRGDYEWSREQIERHELAERVKAVLLSPVFGRIEPRQIIEWMLEDRLPRRGFNCRFTNSFGSRAPAGMSPVSALKVSSHDAQTTQ